MRTVGYAISVLAAGGLGLLLGQHSTHQEIPPKTTHRVLYYVDPAHPAYRSEKSGFAPDGGMQLKPVYADEENLNVARNPLPPVLGIKIDSNKQRLFGIQLAKVEKSSSFRLRVLGRVAADESRVYRLNVAADGLVKETSDDGIGSYVRKDQRLAVIYSPEFLSIAGGYLSANERTQRGNNREGEPISQGVAGPQNWADRLRNLGMSDSQIRELNSTRKIPEVVYINSPIDGFIVARNISAGETFDRYSEFYRIADLSRVWVLADVFAAEAQYFRPGQIARVTLSGEKRKFRCVIANVLPQVNTATRTLQLRLEADNKDFELRPDMLVDVELNLPAPAGLSVPEDAVLDSGASQRVFVERNDGYFEAREVETGQRFSDRVQILKGLTVGEKVVASGTFLVDAENRLSSPSTSKASPRRGDDTQISSEMKVSAPPRLRPSLD